MTSLKEWIDTKIEDGNINHFEYNNFSNIVRISEGGFGIVNRADWNNGGIKVALKSLLNNSTIEEDQKENFLKEVTLISKMISRHFGICNYKYELII